MTDRSCKDQDVIAYVPLDSYRLDGILDILARVASRLRSDPVFLPPLRLTDKVRAEMAQYDAQTLLNEVKTQYGHLHNKVMGLTALDISARGFNYLFGLADPGSGVAILSVARLIKHGDEHLTLSRIEKEVTHELGHLFGLKHCRNSKCVMSFSNNVIEVDGKSADFCSDCDYLLFK